MPGVKTPRSSIPVPTGAARTIIVTRPREQAQGWVARLQANGLSAAAVPLLAIEPTDQPQGLREALIGGEPPLLVFFVSPSAVQHFFDQVFMPAGEPAVEPSFQPFVQPPAERAPAATAWPSTVWAAAPGPGTAQALLARGVTPSRVIQPPADAAQFDSEAVWPQIRSLPLAGRRVLIVRGQGGREWLADRLASAGAKVECLTAYRRGPPQLNTAEWHTLEQAWRAPDRALWLWTSGEALGHLPALIDQLAKRLDGPSAAQWLGQVQGLATHPRILEQARHLGFVRAQACEPSLEGIVSACAAYNPLHREP